MIGTMNNSAFFVGTASKAKYYAESQDEKENAMFLVINQVLMFRQ